MVRKLKYLFAYNQKIHYILSSFLIVVFLNFFFRGAEAATLDTNNSSIHSIIYLTMSPVFEMSQSDFFDVYRSTAYFGGGKTKFSPGASIGIGTKIDFIDNFRFGAELTYINASLEENIIQPVTSSSSYGSRELFENIKLSSMPLIITAEYIPYQSQFRSYFGGGMGVNIASFKWTEILKSSPLDHDRRKGGELLNETDVLPAMRLYVGLDLGFDKLYKDSFLGSLILEARYTKFFGSVDMFSKLKDQVSGDTSVLDKGYLPIPDYMELALSVSFNFKIGKQMNK